MKSSGNSRIILQNYINNFLFFFLMMSNHYKFIFNQQLEKHRKEQEEQTVNNKQTGKLIILQNTEGIFGLLQTPL